MAYTKLSFDLNLNFEGQLWGVTERIVDDTR